MHFKLKYICLVTALASLWVSCASQQTKKRHPASVPSHCEQVSYEDAVSDARAIPHLDHRGRLRGFVIGQYKDGSFWEWSGLRSGDILVAVNGIRVTSQRTAELGFRSICAGKSKITVRRGGKEQDLQL